MAPGHQGIRRDGCGVTSRRRGQGCRSVNSSRARAVGGVTVSRTLCINTNRRVTRLVSQRDAVGTRSASTSTGYRHQRQERYGQPSTHADRAYHGH